jgi:hypothetical protein
VTQTVQVHPTSFTIPKGTSAVLGLDVAAPDGSTVEPRILSVTSPRPTRGPAPAAGTQARPAPLLAAITRTPGSAAVLLPVQAKAPAAGAVPTYTATIKAQNATSGKLLIGYYLPGDADGNGQVDQADLTAIRAGLGSVVGDTKYNFEADSNRDGRIGPSDLTTARRNLGVKTTISPVVTANLDPATDTGASDRITASPTVRINGQASPNATITFTDVDARSPAVTSQVDAAGNYSASLTLAIGVNTFEARSSDSFGQVISGRLAPITRADPARVPPAVATTPISADQTS